MYARREALLMAEELENTCLIMDIYLLFREPWLDSIFLGFVLLIYSFNPLNVLVLQFVLMIHFQMIGEPCFV